MSSVLMHEYVETQLWITKAVSKFQVDGSATAKLQRPKPFILCIIQQLSAMTEPPEMAILYSLVSYSSCQPWRTSHQSNKSLP